MKVGHRVKSTYCQLFLKQLSIAYAFLHHIIFNTTRQMITHFDMLRWMFTHFLYVARAVYALFICRERRLRVLFSHVAKSGSARFVRKVFAREKPLSGKFWVFVPLEGQSGLNFFGHCFCQHLIVISTAKRCS